MTETRILELEDGCETENQNRTEQMRGNTMVTHTSGIQNLITMHRTSEQQRAPEINFNYHESSSSV